MTESLSDFERTEIKKGKSSWEIILGQKALMSEEGIFGIICYFLCSFKRPALAFYRVSKCFSFEDCSNLLNKIEDVGKDRRLKLNAYPDIKICGTQRLLHYELVCTVININYRYSETSILHAPSM